MLTIIYTYTYIYITERCCHDRKCEGLCVTLKTTFFCYVRNLKYQVTMLTLNWKASYFLLLNNTCKILQSYSNSSLVVCVSRFIRVLQKV